MPNYKLPACIRNEIRENVTGLMNLRLAYALADPPITLAQIQRSALEPELMVAMHNILERGANAGSKETNPEFALDRQRIPGLQRSVMLRFHLPAPVLCKQATYGFDQDGAGMDHRHVLGRAETFISCDPAAFEPDELERLVGWAHNVVKVRRLKELVQSTVSDVMTPYIESTGHILARWPILASLIVDERYKTNLNTPPTYLKRYAFDPGKPAAELVQRMRAAEPLLLAAQMLTPLEPANEPAKGKITARLLAYEKLPTDRF